jgi:hypothetical protein
MLSVGILGGWARAAEPNATVPLWPGGGLPPGVKVQDPQNQQPDAQGLIRRLDKPELRVSRGKWMEPLMPWLQQQGFAVRP